MKPPPHIGVVILCGPDPDAALVARASLAPAGHREGLIWAVAPPAAEAAPSLRAVFGAAKVLDSAEGEGLSGRCNRGIREALCAGADYVLLLADTCRLEPGALSPLVIALEAQRQAGAACPALVDGGTGRILACGGEFHAGSARALHRLRGQEPAGPAARHWEVVDFAPACGVLFKRECFEDVGLFHEAFGDSGFDVELGLRAGRERWSTLAVPHAKAILSPQTPDRRSPRAAYERARNPLWLQRGWGRPVTRLATLPLAMSWSWPTAFTAHLFTGRFRCAGAVVRGSLAGLFGKGWQEGGHLAVPWQGRRIQLAVPSAVREMARYL